MPENPAIPSHLAVLVDAIETIVRAAVSPVVERLRTLETAAADVAAMRERVALLEARPPVVGPPGPPGPPGPDGLGFDDYAVEYDGERTLTHRWARGDARAERAVTLPAMIYRGVHVPGRVYARGDCVTIDGSVYHCNAETATRPGDGAPAWTLAVKRGRDHRGRP